MHSRLVRILFLSAWLVASGAVWDLVQVTAWAGMFSDRLETMSVRDAVRLTFFPEEKCRLCLAVEEGKRAEEESAAAAGGDFSSKTPVVFHWPGRVAVNPPESESRARPDSDQASYRRDVPPIPPPRA